MESISSLNDALNINNTGCRVEDGGDKLSLYRYGSFVMYVPRNVTSYELVSSIINANQTANNSAPEYERDTFMQTLKTATAWGAGLEIGQLGVAAAAFGLLSIFSGHDS